MHLKMRSLGPKSTPNPDSGILRAKEGSEPSVITWFDSIKITRKLQAPSPWKHSFSDLLLQPNVLMNVRQRYSTQQIHDRWTLNIALNCFDPAIISPPSSFWIKWTESLRCLLATNPHPIPNHPISCALLLPTKTQPPPLSPSFYEMIMRHVGEDGLYDLWMSAFPYACRNCWLIPYCIGSYLRIDNLGP